MSLSAAHLLVVFGTLGVGVVLFLETGLLLGLVLPGETMTILAGAFSRGVGAGHPHPQLGWVMLSAGLGAIAGGQLGYALGRAVGPRLLDRPDGRVFRRAHVQRTERQFARHPVATLLVARFMPFIRTLATPAAGIAGMPAARFAATNAIGGALWAVSVAAVGYVLGGLVQIERYTTVATLGILAASTTPLLAHALWVRLRPRTATPGG